jgi:uncharacterized Zn finger protein (UPF0148 family)
MSVYVKRTTCRACGAPKVTPPKTGYVYCDYCATLTDWDFNASIATPPDPLPTGQEYATLFANVQKEMKAALAAKDRNRYYQSQVTLYELYAKYFPGGMSPRVRDPEYRALWVEYTALTTTAQDFDPDHTARKEAVDRATRSLNLTTHDGKVRVLGGFWEMWEAFRARLRASLDLNVKVGLLARQPDGAPYELLERMGVSAIVQGWIDKIDPADVERLLVESGMKADYVTIIPPPMKLTKCAGCSGDLHVAQGARRVLCEACGRLNAMDVSTMACPTCGANIAINPGQSTIACPYCKSNFSQSST